MKGQLVYLMNDSQGLLFDNHSLNKVELQKFSQHLKATKSFAERNKYVFNNRFLPRLFRMTSRCVEMLDKERFVLSYRHKVIMLDWKIHSMSTLRNCRVGFSNPLNFCSDDDHVYWGDYGNNPNREEVYIYRLNKNLNVDIVYSFPSGTIRHIHNIIFDKDNKRFWIFTGDNEVNAGIYIANKDFLDIKPFRTGDQKYRAVVGFPYKDGLLYATDSVESNNYLYFINKEGLERCIAPMPGSCIYGTELKDYYIFSTTVEPHEGGGFLNLFSYTLGGGIKDRYSHLLAVDKRNMNVKEILKLKKDWLPMKLFQYGSIHFPNGQGESNYLYYNPVACKGDGQTFFINLD